MSDLTAPSPFATDSLSIPQVVSLIFVVTTVNLVWWMVGGAGIADGGLAGADGYMRLVRVERLVETGAWFDIGIPRANAPYGGSLHWTRLFDGILLALALPLTSFLEFKAALYWAGVLVSPILHCAMAITLAWAALPILGRTGAWLAGLLTALQFGILAYATLGHADHHVLFGLLAALSIGLTFRSLALSDGGGRVNFALGCTLACGIWVGPEAAVLMTLCLGVTALPWLAGENRSVRRNKEITLGLAIALTLVILVERGAGGFLAIHYDRVSIVYVALAALLGIFWLIAETLSSRLSPPRPWPIRLAIGACGIVAIALIMRTLFPQVFMGPLADLDPKLISLLSEVREFGGIDTAQKFLVYAGSAAIAVPWAIWLTVKEWPSPERWKWVMVAACLFVYLASAANWLRNAIYADLFIALCLAGLLVHLDRGISARFSGALKSLLVVLSFAVIAVGPLAAATLISGLWKFETAAETRPSHCPVTSLSEFLNSPPWGKRSQIILASANFGPEILYRTPHSVTATLHHPSADGILFNLEFLGSTNEVEALDLLRQRRIDLILLCRHSGDIRFSLSREDKRVFNLRLEANELPPWLRAVRLPNELSRSFQLFQVIEAGSP